MVTIQANLMSDLAAIIRCFIILASFWTKLAGVIGIKTERSTYIYHEMFVFSLTSQSVVVKLKLVRIFYK